MTGDSPSKDPNDWQHLTSLRRNLAFGTGSACNITNGITLHPKTRQSERPFWTTQQHWPVCPSPC